jgi:hypothetical protein
MRPIKIGFVLLSNSRAPLPSTRVVVLNMLPFLRRAGFEPHIVFEPPTGVEQPELPADLAQRLAGEGFRIVFLQKVRGPSVQAFVQQAARLGIRTVFGVCDLVDTEMVAHTDVTVAVTPYLKSLYPGPLQHKIHVVHDGIENPAVFKTHWGDHSGSRARPLRAVLVISAGIWRLPHIGSPPPWLRVTVVGRYPPATQYLRRLREARWKYLSTHGRDRADFVRFTLDPRIRCEAWDPVGVYGHMQRADIGIIPIEYSPEVGTSLPVPLWSVKSENRLTMKMALGLPVIASPIPSYEPVMAHGTNGFFANGAQEWMSALEALRDPALRRRIGEAARASVLHRYSMEEQARLMIEVLQGLLHDDVAWAGGMR